MKTKNQILNDIKLVNFKTHRGHDGDGFNADIIYKGNKIAHVHDDAWGGEFNYTVIGKIILDKKGNYQKDSQHKKNDTLFQELWNDVNNLPSIYDEDLKRDFKDNLDTLISKKCDELLLKKDEKKGVMIKNNHGWSIVGFKTSIPTTIAKWSDGLEAIQQIYDEQLKKGKTVLNKAYLKSVGVNV